MERNAKALTRREPTIYYNRIYDERSPPEYPAVLPYTRENLRPTTGDRD